MDEKKLVKRAQAGDFAAFQSLVEPHQKRLFALAKRMTGNEQDAEDIVQDTLLKAIDKLETFRAESSFGDLALLDSSQCRSTSHRSPEASEHDSD